MNANSYRIFKSGLFIISVLVGLLTVYSPEVEASYPGYSGRIFFWSGPTDNYDIYSMDANGQNIANITNHPGQDFYPSVSPDGTKIAFSSERDGDREIYVMNADGSNQVRLTNSPGQDMLATWSPDGSEIAFRSSRDGNTEIYVMKADGSDQVNVTNNPAGDGYPDWSAGNVITFVSTRSGSSAIYTMNPEGGEVTPLGMGNTMPSWSPDGQKLVYKNSPTGTDGLFIADKNGENIVNYSNDGLIISYPAWSPDGKFVIFHTEVGGNHELRRLSLDSGQVSTVPVAEELTGNFYSWQPVPNKTPIATADVLSVNVNKSGLSDVLANDSDEESLQASQLSITAEPTKGNAAIESGKVKYTPNQNYVGADQLVYRICDSFMLDPKCSTAVLSIEVKPTATVAKVGRAALVDGQEKVVAQTSRPTFSGTATPYSTVKVEIHSDPIILTTTADGDGNWSITPDEDLPAGDHTVYISATLNGVTTELDSFVLAVQQVTPNTGFDSFAIRIGGLVLLIGGLVSVFVYRHRARDCFELMPRLFP